MRYDSSSDVIRIDIQPSASLRPGPGQYYHLYQPFVLRGWWENHPFSLGAYTTTPPQPSPQPNEKTSEATAGAEPTKDPTATTKRASSSISSSASSTTSPPQNLVFWIHPHDGWTRRLRDACLKAPSGALAPRLLLEGPYGRAHALHAFDAAVLLVGGTGIAAAAPYVLEHVRAARTTRTTKVRLVWAAKRAAFLRGVCVGELAGVVGREDVEVVLFATGDAGDAGKREDRAGDEIQPAGAARAEVEVKEGRPDVAGVVAEAAAEATESGARTVLFVCGPPAMADEARAQVHREMRGGCRRIEYVEECFRW